MTISDALARRSMLLGLTGFASGLACGNLDTASAGRRRPDSEERDAAKGGAPEQPTVIPPAVEIGLCPPEIDDYAAQHSIPESDAMIAIAAETKATTEWWIMMIGPVEAGLLRMLVHLLGAKRVVELGTFTGYSAIAMAEALPEGGTVITCDISEEWTDIAKKHWASSPHGGKIDLRLGPAKETLSELPGPYDLVFIDADKRGYIDYWEACVPKLAPRGVIVADNVLGNGHALDPKGRSAAAAFNAHVAADARMQSVMLPIRDGVTVAWRRAG